MFRLDLFPDTTFAAQKRDFFFANMSERAGKMLREDMEVKRQVLAAVAPHVREDAIFTSNTSGLSLKAMAEACPRSSAPMPG